METRRCTNCKTALKGNYCHNCGQKKFSQADKNLKGIAEEALHFLTHLEGTFFRTMKAVILRPGTYSMAYCNGIRKTFYKPVSFYLMIIILYLLLPAAEGMNQRMMFYKTHAVGGQVMTRQIENKMKQRNISEEELAKLFREKSEKTSKILLLILIPLTALVLYCIFFRSGFAAYDYFILATEINSFILLVVFLLVPIVTSLVGTFVTIHEFGLTLVLSMLLIAYWFIIFRRFFQPTPLWAIGGTILFVFGYYIVTQIIYKFILFQATIMMV